MKTRNIVAIFILVIALAINCLGQQSKRSRYVEYDSAGNVPIGVTGTGSKLAVGGVIESTSGGIKFPDGSTQIQAGITQLFTSGAITGNGTAESPLTFQTTGTAVDPDATRQPFNKRILTNPGTTSVVMDTVPAGKILVLEFITGYTSTLDTVTNTWFEFTINGVASAFVTPRNSLQHSAGLRMWQYADPLKMRLSAGQVLGVNMIGNAENLIILNGYYVNAP